MPICEQCGDERPWVHRHHKIPKSQGGSDDPSNIQILCANCHEEAHGGPCGGRDRWSPEANAKRGESLQRRWQDVHSRASLIAGQKQGWEKADEATRAARVAGMERHRIENPEAVLAHNRENAEKLLKGKVYPRDENGHAIGPRTGLRIGRKPGPRTEAEVLAHADQGGQTRAWFKDHPEKAAERNRKIAESHRGMRACGVDGCRKMVKPPHRTCPIHG